MNTAIFILIISVLTHLLWVHLDANPPLYLHDVLLTTMRSKSLHDKDFMEGISSSHRRRILGKTHLEGKTVWITGASSGIGAELAVQLALAGVSRIVLSAQRKEKLEEVAESCRHAAEARKNAFGGNNKATAAKEPFEAIVIPFNLVGGNKAIDIAVSKTLSALGPSGVDILVLNAGKYQLSPALETDVDNVLPQITQINYASPVQLSNKLIKEDRWKERKHEKKHHIVVTSSIMGRGPNGLNAIYSASKHALRAYFQTLAAEENSWLRVDIASPGSTATELWESAMDSSPNKDEQEGNAGIVRPYADDRTKMDVRRCAQLMISGMVGPAFMFHETWITKNPGLLWAYSSTYLPSIFRPMNDLIARLRVEIWRKDGSDPLYLPTLLRHFFTGR